MVGLKCNKCAGKCGEWASLILRVVIGLVFFAHGSQKLLGWFGGPGLTGTTGFLAQLGFAAAGFWAWVLALTEFLGGIALVLGLGTSIAAALLGIVMLVAAFTVHLKNGLFLPAGVEFVLVLLAGLIALILNGSGKWSVDGRFCCKRQEGSGVPS